MYLAYNTNGLAHHRLEEALGLLAEVGYGGVALTPDVAHLDLKTCGEADWERIARLLRDLELRCVVETGARYALHPRRKHWPTLVSPDGAAGRRRIDYYYRALEMARALGAAVLSLWSGALEPDVSREQGFAHLLDRLPVVLDRAATLGVRVALEPEPGMLIGDLSSYLDLRRRLRRDDLGTTLDVGHLIVTELGSPHQHLAKFSDTLVNVQLDDARRGVHEHLPLDEGEVDVDAVLVELRRIGYDGPVALELSRDSHRAAEMVIRSYLRLEKHFPRSRRT